MNSSSSPPSLAQLQALASYSRMGMMAQAQYPFFTPTIYMHMTSAALSLQLPSMSFNSNAQQIDTIGNSQDRIESNSVTSNEINNTTSDSDPSNAFDENSIENHSIQSHRSSPIVDNSLNLNDDVLMTDITHNNLGGNSSLIYDNSTSLSQSSFNSESTTSIKPQKPRRSSRNQKPNPRYSNSLSPDITSVLKSNTCQTGDSLNVEDLNENELTDRENALSDSQGASDILDSNSNVLTATKKPKSATKNSTDIVDSIYRKMSEEVSNAAAEKLQESFPDCAFVHPPSPFIIEFKGPDLFPQLPNNPSNPAEITEQWFLANLPYPFPTSDDFRELLYLTGYGNLYLNQWLIQRRKHFIKHNSGNAMAKQLISGWNKKRPKTSPSSNPLKRYDSIVDDQENVIPKKSRNNIEEDDQEIKWL